MHSLVYCDGGPDHRLTYLSVQLSLISLYLRLNLDFLCVCRTAPYHSWRNPVERIMSILNLGFQCIGLMRTEASKDCEDVIKKCNNMSQLRESAEKMPTLRGEVLDSVAPMKLLLSDIIVRLKLKQKPFEIQATATDGEIRALWDLLLGIDPTLEFGEKMRKSSLGTHPEIEKFISHCCQLRHYSFCVKKCGRPDCDMCQPPRLPSHLFSRLHFLPDPTPTGDGHYKPFNEVYGTVTKENHRPSYPKKTPRSKNLPFVASIQHVRNVGLVIMCKECNMWRLLYSPTKLSDSEKQELNSLLTEFTFTCGGSLSDLGLSGKLGDVCVRKLECSDPVEKLYYSMKYDPICIYCSCEDNLTTPDNCYPLCEECKARPPIRKRV